MTDIQKFIQDYRALEHDLLSLIRYIDLAEENYKVNSAEVRKLILASCSMIESIVPAVEKSINHQHDQKQRCNNAESIAMYIKRFTNEKEFDLTNIQPMLYGEKFNPWNTLDWWHSYNKIKHQSKSDRETEYFKAAIYSVLAFFSLVVLLTRTTTINLFWHPSDVIKLSVKNSNKPIDYNSSTTLKHIIWPKGQ